MATNSEVPDDSRLLTHSPPPAYNTSTLASSADSAQETESHPISDSCPSLHSQFYSFLYCPSHQNLHCAGCSLTSRVFCLFAITFHRRSFSDVLGNSESSTRSLVGICCTHPPDSCFFASSTCASRVRSSTITHRLRSWIWDMFLIPRTSL